MQKLPPVRARPSCSRRARSSRRSSSARWADPSRAVRAHRALTCPAGPVPSQAAARGTAHRARTSALVRQPWG
eukprot:5284854-Alexandrium_andersonii.AAC.1